MSNIEMLKEWFKDSHQDLLRFLWKASGDQHFAEEILQETYVRGYLKFHLFEPTRGSLKNWLYRMALNLLHDAQRKAARERNLLFPLPSKETGMGKAKSGEPAAQHPATHKQLDEPEPADLEQTREHMRQALAMIDQEKRELLLLAVHNPLSDLAEIYKVPEGNIKSRIHYARRELHILFQRLVESPPNGQ